MEMYLHIWSLQFLSLLFACSLWGSGPLLFSNELFLQSRIMVEQQWRKVTVCTSLVHCTMCCLKKPRKPENLWKATICVHHSYFMDNNSDLLLWKQQQVIAGKLSKSLKCLAVLFQWLYWRLSVEFRGVKHKQSQVPCLSV